jgi:sulfoxide reductase catalytic subunit YedY
MLIKRATDIPSSEITSEYVYRNRRDFIKAATGTLGAAAIGSILPGYLLRGRRQSMTPMKNRLQATNVTTYNNYYEFGTDKGEPAVNAVGFRFRPWTIAGQRNGQKAGHVCPRRSAQRHHDGRPHLPACAAWSGGPW